MPAAFAYYLARLSTHPNPSWPNKRIKFIIGLVQIGGMSQTMRKIDIVKNLIRQRMEGLH